MFLLCVLISPLQHKNGLTSQLDLGSWLTYTYVLVVSQCLKPRENLKHELEALFPFPSILLFFLPASTVLTQT